MRSYKLPEMDRTFVGSFAKRNEVIQITRLKNFDTAKKIVGFASRCKEFGSVG